MRHLITSQKPEAAVLESIVVRCVRARARGDLEHTVYQCGRGRRTDGQHRRPLHLHTFWYGNGVATVATCTRENVYLAARDIRVPSAER